MQEFGQFLLILSFFATLVTALTAMAGAMTRRADLMRGARFGVYAVAALNVAMALVLTHGFLTHDFNNKYIAAYSGRSMPTVYLLAAFWGGEKGALLFWTTSLSVFSAIAVHVNREKAMNYMAWVAAILMLSLFFFDILMVFESSPFETFLTSEGPRDGKGLNPQLQNPTMAFHPPSLLTGYITFTIPFAFAMAALITGRLDSQWITDTRRWTLVSFLFLTIGLILGMVWAYEEIGWGFWWMWDPVENAGLIPWFTATAYLHSVMIQERRGMFKRWNMILVCLTFFLTIFGTFLTRSQLIDSIHSFAESTLADYFIWYLAILGAVSVILIGYRWKALRGEESIESFWSRESFFVLNNLFLVSCAFIVLFGTLIPKITELESIRDGYNGIADVLGTGNIQQAISLDEGWFNEVMAPIGLLLLLLAGAGPLISWRRATLSNFQKNFLRPLCGALVITAVGTIIFVWVELVDMTGDRFLIVHAEWLKLSVAEGYDGSVALWFAELFGSADTDGFKAYMVWTAHMDYTGYYIPVAYFMAVFVGWTITREFHRGARIRMTKAGDGYLGSMLALVMKTPRRYGGYIVHLGIVLMFIAFTGKFFKFKEEPTLHQGETVSAKDYRLTYAKKVQLYDDENGYAADRAHITVIGESETAAPGEVDDLATWLKTQDPGVFHLETQIGSPKITARFKSDAARDRIREDLYLAMQFRKDFVLRTEDRASHALIYTIADVKLMNAMPMAIMYKVRRARQEFEQAKTYQGTLRSQPGSPNIRIRFQDDASLVAFTQRLARVQPPEHLSAVFIDTKLEALQFIDARTGVTRTPEVRYYPSHPGSPTTEASITSGFAEDLYLAVQPRMGVADAFSRSEIKLLTVVFPFVNFLWTGGLLIVFGILVCMIPRWLSRTLISVTRRRRRSGASDAITLALLSLFISAMLGSVAPPAAASRLPVPAGFAEPAGDPGADLMATLRCVCGYGDARQEVPGSLNDGACACPRAEADRKIVRGLLAQHSAIDQQSGRAKFLVLSALAEKDAEWLERTIYSAKDFDFIVGTTKTTCAGERGLLLSQSQLGCSVRNLWMPRFRLMLASGISPRVIFEFYVNENNITMHPEKPWTYDDLYAAADKPLTWFLPLSLSVGFIFVFVGLTLRRTRRLRAGRAQGADSSQDLLNPEDRLRLEDELDEYEL